MIVFVQGGLSFCDMVAPNIFFHQEINSYESNKFIFTQQAKPVYMMNYFIMTYCSNMTSTESNNTKRNLKLNQIIIDLTIYTNAILQSKEKIFILL